LGTRKGNWNAKVERGGEARERKRDEIGSKGRESFIQW
jgi:hypothetical protein